MDRLGLLNQDDRSRQINGFFCGDLFEGREVGPAWTGRAERMAVPLPKITMRAFALLEDLCDPGLGIGAIRE